MAALPADVPTGLVVGQFYFVNEDGVDVDTNPELTVVSGAVTFTASVPLIRMASKASVLVPLEFKGVFDGQGRLVSASDASVGIKLPATDSNLFNPTGFTWKVTFDLVQVANRHTISIDSFNIQVPAGVTTDLVNAMPVSSSPGVLTIVGSPGAPGNPGPVGPPGPAVTPVVIGPQDPVPANIPAGTVIFRTA